MEDMKTTDGTYWDSDGNNIRLLHINEQWPLWLTKQDLEDMLIHLEVEQPCKGKTHEDL